MTAGKDKNTKHASEKAAEPFPPVNPADPEDCTPDADQLDDPTTLTSRNNLAGAYQSAGRLGEAIPLYEQTLADSVRVLGAAAQGSSVSAAAEMLKNLSATAAAAGVQNSASRTMAEMLKNVYATAAGAAQGSSVSAAAEMLKNLSAATIGLSEPALSIQSAIRAAALPFNANTVAAVREISAGGLSSASDARLIEGWQDSAAAARYFKSVSSDPLRRSSTPMSAEEYFSEDEGEVTSLADLHVKIERLVSKNPGLVLVWRGHQDATWGLHSTLYRALKGSDGDSYPSEDEMVTAEKEVLRKARDEWRLNDMSAIEVLARLQHYGAPTRLLDVSRNPLIAAWFAVEAGTGDDQDGRLLALATGPVPREPATFVPSLALSASELSTAQGPIWHSYKDATERRSGGWGTGGSRLVWIPSVYEERMSAQNAGFVLDGMPIISEEILPFFRGARGDRSLTNGDLLAVGSIFAHTQKTTRKATRVGPGFAPTFSFRIPQEVKSELREKLASRYALTRGTIYPDVAGLAKYIKADLKISQQ